MKSDTVYKRAYNTALDLLGDYRKGDHLPSENELSDALAVSRTTVRKVLAQLTDHGYVAGAGKDRKAGNRVRAAAYFPTTETVPTAQQVESRFMDWMLRGDTKPGTLINELELARQFNVGTTGIREFLNRFRRFALIEKRANAGWLFKGFTQDFAAELFEIRELRTTLRARFRQSAARGSRLGSAAGAA